MAADASGYEKVETRIFFSFSVQGCLMYWFCFCSQ
jgi:hypothetical protein